MPKRLGATEIWEKAWFRKMPGTYKLVSKFIWDRCDHAGVWSVDHDLAKFLMGEEYDPQTVIDLHQGRICPTEDGSKWVLIDFIPFQQNSYALNPENKAHLGILRLFQKHGFTEEFVKNTLNIDSPYKGASKPLPRVTSISISKSTSKSATSSRFKVPTPSEVSEYSKSISYPMNGEAWCDSYAQKNWMVGKNKMKDWKAAVRNWKRNGWNPSKQSGRRGPNI